MGPTDAVLSEIANRFFQHSDEDLHAMSRAAADGCQDFSECLREACIPGTTVTSGNSQDAYKLWRNVRESVAPQLRQQHSLAFAHYMARNLAPFFCKGPPPPPLPVRVEGYEEVRYPSSACGANRAMEADTQRGWLGVLGVVLLIVTVPWRFEWKMSEFLFSLQPNPYKFPDIT